MLFILVGLAAASEITVLGWSPNERYVAIRTIDNLTTDDVITGKECGVGGEEDYHPDFTPPPKYPSNVEIRCTTKMTFCPEYVSPETKIPFSGDLKITIFEVQQAQVNRHVFLKLVPATPVNVIYEAGYYLSTSHSEDGSSQEIAGKCTPHATAATELKKAKSMLKKYQIDTKSTGGSVSFEEIINSQNGHNYGNGAIGYSIGSSVAESPSPAQPTNIPQFQTGLTYLITMQKERIDGMNIMVLGWNKLYEGEAPETLEHFGDLNLLYASPFQSVYTPAWAGSSEHILHSVHHSPSGELLLFAHQNSVSQFYGDDHTVELTFPMVVNTEELYKPR